MSVIRWGTVWWSALNTGVSNQGYYPARSGNRSPDLFQQLIHGRVVVFKFGPDKGIEIVDTPVSFGCFRKILLMIGESVMANRGPRVEEYLFVMSLKFGSTIDGQYFRMVEMEELVVVGMGEFMQYDIGVFRPHVWIVQSGCLGYVYVFGESWIMAMGNQPGLIGVVLHVVEARVVPFQTDGELLQFLDSVERENELNTLQVVG